MSLWKKRTVSLSDSVFPVCLSVCLLLSVCVVKGVFVSLGPFQRAAFSRVQRHQRKETGKGQVLSLLQEKAL